MRPCHKTKQNKTKSKQKSSSGMEAHESESEIAGTRRTPSFLAMTPFWVPPIESVSLRWETAQVYACCVTSRLSFFGFCVLATCLWNEWLSNCLKSEMALLYNFRRREPLLIFLKTDSDTCQLFEGVYGFVTYVVIWVPTKQVPPGTGTRLPYHVSTRHYLIWTWFWVVSPSLCKSNCLAHSS